jgi:RNA polymerase sigma factor (sigma-70 family)
MSKKKDAERVVPHGSVQGVDDDRGSDSTVSGHAATPEDVGLWRCIREERLVLLRALSDRIRRCAMAITGDRDWIDDIEQEVNEKVMKIPQKSWDAISHKEAYVIAIARNVSKTWLTQAIARNSKHRSLKNMEQHKVEGPLADLSGPACAVDDLVRILRPLGDDCAQVFVRVRLFGRSAAHVALVLNMNVSTVRRHLERADLHFMRLLEEERSRPSVASRLAKLFKRGLS